MRHPKSFRHAKNFFLFALIASILGLWNCSAGAQSAPGPESGSKTLSPYFFVQSDDPNLDQLPLKSTSADVKISGMIANVTVVQVYKNEGKKALEAIYVFPASTRAAVYGMKMTIGERSITAQIQKRDEARRAYENARQEGKSASLLEQQRPNVFQMNVANIMPGDEIKTELKYTEFLVPTDGIYEFVYPTVVGPRYSNQAAATANPSEKWSQNPYLHEGEAPRNTFDIKVNLAAGVPIAEMSCPSHKTGIHYADKSTAAVDLEKSEKFAGNRDFILKYRLAGDRIESGMILYQGERENFFLLMMQPPKRVTESAIPPREYIFIIDVSGSMHGYPLGITKKLFKDLVSGLRPTDTFNVLLFSGGSDLLSEKSLPATSQNIQHAIQVIDRQQGGGGTELLPAMERALRSPRTEGVSRTFVIATDGYVTVEPEVFDLIRTKLGEANFFAFGIGTSVNRHLIEGMARIGAGEPFIITKEEEARAKAEKFRQYIQYPLLTQVKMDFGSFETYDVEPSHIPDLFAERPLIVFGKWRGTPKGTVSLSGITGKDKYSTTLEVSGIKPSGENSALQYLWARSRIAQLADYGSLGHDDGLASKVTELGLTYNLLTAYTSFVAIDSEVRNRGGDASTVKQPLPLPEGVGDLAVGEPRHMKAMAAPSPGLALRMPIGAGASPPAQEHVRNDTALTAVKKEAAPSTIIEKLTVKGVFSEAEIRRYIEQHQLEIEQCLQNLGTASPLKLVIKWTIDSNGAVKDVLITPEGQSKYDGNCLSERIAKWIFPVPSNGRKVQVSVTIIAGA